MDALCVRNSSENAFENGPSGTVAQITAKIAV
jgi:hypothetical protein